MKSGQTIYLAVAACVAVVLLFAFGLNQFGNHANTISESEQTPFVSDVVADYDQDMPIQPLILEQNLNPEIVALGDMLFHDTRLSATDSVSCASCHNLERGGVDALSYSVGVNGAIGGINSPTVFNASLNIAQFWDGRSETLADQIDGPIHNEKELGTNWTERHYHGKYKKCDYHVRTIALNCQLPF